MTRLLALMMLMILGALAVRTQIPKGPGFTYGAINGLAWSNTPRGDKLAYVNGALDGYIMGTWTLATHVASCKQWDGPPAWFNSKATAVDVVKEMDAFYQDGEHISIRVMDALVYSEMKLYGSTKQALDSYLKSVK